jgi:hypothetical protein
MEARLQFARAALSDRWKRRSVAFTHMTLVKPKR